MLYSIVLGLHLFAAATTGVILLFALYILVRSRGEWYRLAALALAGVAVFEVASGVVLTTLSPTITATELSGHLALYLGVCLAVETFLYIRSLEKITSAAIQ